MGVTVRQKEKGKGKPWWVFIGVLIIFQIIIINAYTQSVKEQYELQERCGKDAAAFFDKFKKEFQSIPNTGVSYTCHYNKKLNKCFILITSISTPSDEYPHPSITKTLCDVNENKVNAYFFMFTDTMKIMQCTVLDKHYATEAEWDAAVKQYMEE
jgi:hypothetical protein